jgi:hypothetical protein
MNLTDFWEAISLRRIEVINEGEGLRLNGHKDSVDSTIIRAARQHKSEIIAELHKGKFSLFALLLRIDQLQRKHSIHPVRVRLLGIIRESILQLHRQGDHEAIEDTPTVLARLCKHWEGK